MVTWTGFLPLCGRTSANVPCLAARLLAVETCYTAIGEGGSSKRPQIRYIRISRTSDHPLSELKGGGRLCEAINTEVDCEVIQASFKNCPLGRRKGGLHVSI